MVVFFEFLVGHVPIDYLEVVEGTFVFAQILTHCDLEAFCQGAGFETGIIRLRFIGLQSNFVGLEKAAVQNVFVFDVPQSGGD